MKSIKCFFVEDTGKLVKWREVIGGDGEILGKTQDRIIRRTDPGEEFAELHNAPPGAMWFAEWYDDMFEPQLEHVLVVNTPGGVWIVDSQSSNCTMPVPDDFHGKRQTDHHCWIIEGVLPNISVSKNGKTCGAGAGSIQCGSYHGFLRNGYLEEC